MSIEPAENDRVPGRPVVAADFPADFHGFSVGMALPDAGFISGITTWGFEVAMQLAGRGWHFVIFEEAYHRSPRLDRPGLTGVDVIQVPSADTESDEARRVSTYQQALPAIFVPNCSPSMYPACALLSRKEAARMRVIGICHSFEDFYFEILRYYEPVIHRFVAVSEECADALRRLLPHRYADIHVRPCAIRWPPELQREYAPPGKPLRLLYAGRVVQEQKRVFDLLRLAQELTRQGVNFELRVVGEGKDKPDLERQWQGLHPAVRARVRMEAGVPAHEIAEQFLRADVVVLVSAYEGTSVFMLAGMSYGCVPVVTQVSGTAGTVSPGTTGFVHPVGDLEAMAASIRSLDADRELLARVGANARARSREFDMGAYVAWFEQLLGEAWDQDPPRVWPAERPIRRERLLVRIGKYVPWARPLWRRCRTWMFGGG